MKKKRFSKLLIGGAGAPLLAAMAASVFFSATPGLLYAGPLTANGVFVTPVNTGTGATNLTVREIENGRIRMTYNGQAKDFFRSRAAGNQDRRLNREVDLIVEKCFPRRNGSGPSGEFTAADVQIIINFFGNN